MRDCTELINIHAQTCVANSVTTLTVPQVCPRQNNGREPQGRTGRDLAAIQVQRAVRGWQARVLAVKLVHDRAWRALLLIQVCVAPDNRVAPSTEVFTPIPCYPANLEWKYTLSLTCRV